MTGFIGNIQSSSNGHSAELQIVSLAGSADDDSDAEVLEYCPWCKERVGDEICCDQCIQWYHLNSENLNEAECDDIQSDQPFFCKNCQLENSNLLSESLVQWDLRNDETDQKEMSSDTILARSGTHSVVVVVGDSELDIITHQITV